MPNITNVKFPTVAGMSVPQMAKYGAVGYNILKGLINSELKRYDLGQTLSPSTTVQFVCLSEISQGNDVGNRDGNKVLGKYLRFQYTCAIGASATSTTMRVLVFVDTENTGTAPTAASVLQFTTAVFSLTSPINSDSTQRYTVLFDDKVNFASTGLTITTREHYKPLNFHLNFVGSLGTDYNKNSIWLCFISNEATNVPSLVYTSRLSFYDN